MKIKGSADEILNNLAEITDQPYEKAKEWKKLSGSKVIGLFPMHFPEELIHAARILPVLLQESDEPVTAGHAYYYPFFCGLSRSVIDQAAKGYLDFLDGFMAGDYCIQVVGAGEVLGVLLRKANSMFFRLPVGNQSWTLADITQGLKEIKRDIETFSGEEISDEAIRESIRIYNMNRGLIRKLYEIKSLNPWILNSREIVTIIKSSMVIPKDEHNTILTSLLQVLPNRKVSQKEGVRVFVSGSLCGAPKYDILSMIEQSGAIVVGDDLFHGYRYVSTDINEEMEPLEAIAAHYLEKNKDVPCPTRCDPTTDWPQYLIDSMRKHEAEKLVILMAKYCEPHMFFYPDIKEALEKAGIPHLLIEMEHEVVSLEALRTRIEAFIEMK
ncbi:2-hydroxyacyl-CoA dehydratase [Desulfallas sp. Bu1-1]|uniref:2-hydroxyacyl-CoA dehydratase subunit D n=1 Tax=Desulfallas sp. Bu1-1 TaxID=2787620 RepID=UPI00189FD1B2|nr:2-hydroxyacyl-CoA dehydratase family protein [Desulfallas sp. Bu1-1]MBF7082849.1 2-hydroxyacyl-CoA dehydratase [Desulfallas sp. Bu1-1]